MGFESRSICMCFVYVICIMVYILFIFMLIQITSYVDKVSVSKDLL